MTIPDTIFEPNGFEPSERLGILIEKSILGIPEGTVWSRASRARRLMRTAMTANAVVSRCGGIQTVPPDQANHGA